MKAARIAFRGNYLPPHSSENHWRRTMESLGHTIIPIQENEVEWSAVPQLCAEQHADLFFWVCTWHEDLEGGHQALRALHGAGLPTVSYHLDLYAGLDREALIPDDPFWATRYVFTADGGHQQRFAELGVNHHWIRPGVVADETDEGTPDGRYAGSVGFTGSYRKYHPEWIAYRRQLVDGLRARYGPGYRHFGGGIEPQVRGRELNNAIATIPVWVGDSLCLDFKHPRYWSDRATELIGRGAFLIHPWIEGMDDELKDGEHLRYYQFGDFDGLYQLIDHYLAHPDEREQIRRAGHEFVRANCTYTHRLQQAFEIICQTEPQLRSTRERIQIRPETTDAVVMHEIWDEEVYRVRDDLIGTDGVVLDIGANIGAFSVWALHEAGARRVFAIEPDPANFAALQANALATGYSEVIECEPVALGGCNGSGRLTPRDGNSWVVPDALGGIQVPVRTLDWAVARVGRVIDLCKIDTEGAEYEILLGASPTTLGLIRTIVLEFHGRGMLADREGGPRFGELVERLGEFFKLDIIGRPSLGGTIYARSWR